MKLREQGRRLSRRIDGLGLRERCMLFASIALLMAAAADSLVLSPALAEQKLLAARLKQDNAELVTLRARLAQAARTPDADSPVMRLRRDIARLQARQQAVDADIERLGSTASVRSSRCASAARSPAVLPCSRSFMAWLLPGSA